MTTLREEDGVAYTPWAAAQRFGEQVEVAIGATVPLGALEATTARIGRWIVDPAGPLVGEDDTSLRHQVLAAEVVSRQTQRGTARSLRDAWLDGHGLLDWRAVAPLAEGVHHDAMVAVFGPPDALPMSAPAGWTLRRVDAPTAP